jgi:multidrug resistance efflux pump
VSATHTVFERINPRALLERLDRRTLVLASLVVVLVLLGLASSCSLLSKKRVRLTGVVASEEVVVTAQTGGAIRELLVEEGDRVDQGDLIVVLDRKELEAEERRQRALVTQLSAQVEQSREQASLEGNRVTAEFAGAEAELDFALSQQAEAEAELAQLRNDLENARDLGGDGLVPERDIDYLQTQVTVAEARLKSSADRVRATEAALELARAKQRQVEISELDVEQTKARLDQARAELDQILVQIGYADIRAPRSGTVSLRVVNEGEVAKPGDPLLTIVDLGNVWVSAQVGESLVDRLAVGQTLEVQLASGRKIEGKISFISPEAAFATQRDVNRETRDIRTFGIKVVVPNEERVVHPGMTAYVFLP